MPNTTDPTQPHEIEMQMFRRQEQHTTNSRQPDDGEKAATIEGDAGSSADTEQSSPEGTQVAEQIQGWYEGSLLLKIFIGLLNKRLSDKTDFSRIKIYEAEIYLEDRNADSMAKGIRHIANHAQTLKAETNHLYPCFINYSNGHWVFLGLEFNAEQKIVDMIYIDSLQYSIPLTEALLTQAAELLQPNHCADACGIRCMDHLKQPDLNSCAPLSIENALWICEQWLHDKTPGSEPMQEHSTEVDIQKIRQTHFATARECAPDLLQMQVELTESDGQTAAIAQTNAYLRQLKTSGPASLATNNVVEALRTAVDALPTVYQKDLYTALTHNTDNPSAYTQSLRKFLTDLLHPAIKRQHIDLADFKQVIAAIFAVDEPTLNQLTAETCELDDFPFNDLETLQQLEKAAPCPVVHQSAPQHPTASPHSFYLENLKRQYDTPKPVNINKLDPFRPTPAIVTEKQMIPTAPLFQSLTSSFDNLFALEINLYSLSHGNHLFFKSFFQQLIANLKGRLSQLTTFDIVATTTAWSSSVGYAPVDDADITDFIEAFPVENHLQNLCLGWSDISNNGELQLLRARNRFPDLKCLEFVSSNLSQNYQSMYRMLLYACYNTQPQLALTVFGDTETVKGLLNRAAALSRVKVNGVKTNTPKGRYYFYDKTMLDKGAHHAPHASLTFFVGAPENQKMLRFDSKQLTEAKTFIDREYADFQPNIQLHPANKVEHASPRPNSQPAAVA